MLRLVVLEADDQPLADAGYELHVRDAVRNGKTDGNGVMEEPIPANLENAKLVFPDRSLEVKIHFAHLDPVEEATGVQARLNNLGFWCGAVDGDIGPHTRAALASFQAAHGLDPTGEPTDETRERLRADHDGDGS
jgi:N-acetylmuramoyl-L-alanine amidase